MKKTVGIAICIILIFVLASEIRAEENKYKKYHNERYGFTVTCPDVFTTSRESDNGDGITLTNESKGYKLLIWGSHCIDSDTGKTLLKKRESELSHIEKKYGDAEFYMIVYSDGGGKDGNETLFYEAGKTKDGINTIYIFSFPAAERAKFQQAVSILNNSIRSRQ